MTRLLAQRIAQPSGSQTPDGNAIALPPLTLAGDSVASGTPLYLDENGEILPASVGAVYQLNFRVGIPTVTEKDTVTGKVSRLWAVLSWPAAAPLGRATGSYEVSYCHIIP
ncbi:MAG: hypothetical protein ACAI35_19265 [Candidatus Methylacidiphilales bacterium]|nr:hypothetical protein [Candidatus Methylacidiphilales bacterium]